MIRPLLITFFVLFCTVLASAQNFEFGKVTTEEMNMTKYAKDTSAHAVVLSEFGKSSINVGTQDKITLTYEYHVKIKIFDAKAFDKGTVEVPVYNGSDNDSYEEVSNIKAVTYYKDDNGFTQKAELADKKIYPVKENKHWANYKFALPGLRNGCIIEYKYTIESPYWQRLRSWQMQDDIPKVYSEYEVHIPAFWTFNASIKGALKLTKNKAEIESKCFESHGATCDCSLLNYGMSDIPAFVEDDYMTSSKNFISSINFELVEYTNPYDGSKYKFTKEWRDLDYTLKTDSEFGGQIKRKSLVKDKITPLIAGKTDDLSKAKAIYEYWQKWFKWNDFNGWFSENISKAIDTHSGSIGDINLSLIAALDAAGLNAEAVLVSTRDNGAINTLYPVLNDFNYVVAKLNIGDQVYMLDASNPLLPFGMLPLKCLNDKGRVFSLDKPSYFMDMSLPQREKSSYILDVTLQENGKLKGTLINYSTGYKAYERRAAIKKFNSIDEYIESLNSKLPKWKLLKSDVRNVDSLDMPVIEHYDVEINLYDKLESSNTLTFNPYYVGKLITNPLKLNERSFPIDMGMASEDRYSIILHLPAQYTVETPPQPLALSLPNNGGRYITSYEPGDNSFSFTYLTQFNRSIYGVEEYPYVKEFFNKIIQSQKAEMVFKKK